MSTFLFASIPVLAHTTNPLPFAQRLIDRGHQVLWYASAAYREPLVAAGATVFPYQRAHDFGGAVLEDEFPWLRTTGTIATLRRGFAEIFVAEPRTAWLICRRSSRRTRSTQCSPKA